MLNRAFVGSLCPLLLSFAVAANIQAQAHTAILVGAVRDTSGTPVAAARLSSSGLLTLSDSAGRFALGGLPPGKGTLSARRLGFEPRDVAIEVVEGRTDSVVVILMVLPLDLPGITTEADSRVKTQLAQFYRHRRNAAGRFFDRRDIDSLHVFRTSDLLRRIPSVRLVPDRSGRLQLRMGRTTGRDCPPDFWIDGVRAAFLNVDDIPLEDIEALEVYSGPAGVPPEINTRMGNPGCGAVVIWTRVPG